MAMSKRIERFRNDLIAAIPRFPNDRASKDAMSAKHITDVLISYNNWQRRFIGIRPRNTSVAQEATNDSRWTTWQPQVDKLLAKVQAGEDLTPHLSLEPRTLGYTPKSSAPGATVEERWSDKDQVLNVMGFHHLHLGDITNAQHADRTDELAFCHVTRTDLEILAIFDHSVFTSGSAERMRLHAVHEQRIAMSAPAGGVMIMSAVTLSGTTMDGTLAAQSLMRIIKAIDPMLDDPSKRTELNDTYGISVNRPEKLVWKARYLDFGLYDKESETFLILQKGPT